MKRALLILLKARGYALDAGHDVWDFAIPFRQLRSLRISRNDFRWLVCKRYLEHAIEITLKGDKGRFFRPAGELNFGMQSCFVLTIEGAAFALKLQRDMHKKGSSPLGSAITSTNTEEPKVRPKWDSDLNELRMDQVLIKRFRTQAVNQTTVLCAFEEDGWPDRIDDPLPPLQGLDSKHRLHDTIKCLNRGHKVPLIRFRGDGTGQGIIWELIDPKKL
jgi:hypothetical protein